jgi:hypothetical protein
LCPLHTAAPPNCRLQFQIKSLADEKTLCDKSPKSIYDLQPWCDRPR